MPSDFASKIGKRGARLGGHGKLAARKIPGLEAALLDNGILEIAELANGDARVLKAKVAGATALLIAKAHKIQERLEDTGRPDRILDKDAGDAYRLMQTSDPADCARKALELMQDPQIRDSAGAGVRFLILQFRAPAAPGTAMAIQYYRGAVPEERVRAVSMGFIAAFADALPTNEFPGKTRFP